MDFSKKLKETRLEQGLNQRELAALSELSPQSISSFESGINSPTVPSLLALARALNVSVDYLLGRTDELGASLPVSQKLPDDEFELLRLYRILPPEFRRSLLDSAKLWAGEPTSATDKKKA